MNEEKIRLQVINKICDFLESEGKKIQIDNNKSVNQKAIEVDVLLDTMHFLRDYNKNIKVLQNEVNKNRYKGSERE